MKWEKPQYSKSKADKAGDVLASETSTFDKRNKAMIVLFNWRASHSYPLQILRNKLRRESLKVDPKSITVKRLKRSISIIRKLKDSKKKDHGGTKLSRMQDIGGCRSVVSTVSECEQLLDSFLKSKLRHIRVGVTDYIKNPKPDGYRGIHIVYKYQSDTVKRSIYNDKLIEIQIRTKLQHIWATAVEMHDFFTNQSIKFGGGSKDWRRFFLLISAIFARWEHRNLPPNCPNNEIELYKEAIHLLENLNVIDRMQIWAHSVRPFKSLNGKINPFYCLLEFDTGAKKITITGFSRKQEKEALEQYNNAERLNRRRHNYDVVLVSGDSLAQIKEGYRNYFADVSDFLEKLKHVKRKYKTITERK